MKQGGIRVEINEIEIKIENEKLEKAIKEIKKQLDEKQDFTQKFVKTNIEEQKKAWEEVGVVTGSNGLDNVAQFMSYIDEFKRLKRKHAFSKNQILKLEKMMLTPYFGRIDFIEDGEDDEEKVYIGMAGLIDDNNDFLIYDWRAPISSMYYDYEVGKAQYECPKCIIEGEMTLKRQYKIANEKIQYMFDSNLKIDDEVLQEILSKSADNKMKTIVTTIQKEQNKVIRNEGNKILVVQGPAGSGKTSIALHRIAYLLYKHRNKITSNNILIFSPNEIFNDYISNVLPELGEDNMYQTTYKDYMHKALDIKLAKEDMCDMMEYILNRKRDSIFEKRMKSIKFKVSLEFIDILKSYAHYLDNKAPNFKDIVYKDKLIVDKKELEQLFFHDYKPFSLRRRLNKIKERILFLLEPLEKERTKEIAEELRSTGGYFDNIEVMEKSIIAVREETKKIKEDIFKFTGFNLLNLYRQLFNNIELMKKLNHNKLPEDFQHIKEYTLKCLGEGILNYEDQPALLYLKIILGDVQDTSEIKYIVIDEAQDYIPLQYEILNQLFPRASITMLGDLSQSINAYMNVGGYENISKVFDNINTEIINLTKSYRSTAEITAFARKILGGKVEGEWVLRNGPEPEIISALQDNIYDKVFVDINKLRDKGYKSIGVIVRNKDDSIRAYTHLEKLTDIKLVKKDDEEYINGVVVIPSYLSKGLEFDAVIVLFEREEDYSREDEKNLLYTICTRALHELHIYCKGKSTII